MHIWSHVTVTLMLRIHLLTGYSRPHMRVDTVSRKAVVTVQTGHYYTNDAKKFT